ncbi:LysR family transcriptional regulator [Allocoprobacillus halotolerans]|uniref:LysR family transcriptional regulator n=1 Tax=Allocoprobacillus halotolerans TaxID=2944914 RepID=A0ABY5I857_9FIRM|nr:LysR family transcriptional regulator [Allocoprobacillus halotolerans]UTY40112.1 LysR family transcriptional regulator [Allocoprobacillus halotolerans]
MIDDKMRTFIKVVEYQSYTQAAKHLHITQPAVTQHIKALEEHYQQKFIDSTHKSFRLTKMGELLYHYAKTQIHNENLFQEQLQAVQPSLVIGSTLSIADYYIPHIIATKIIQNSHPCEIVVANTQTLIHKLINGEVECAFVEGQFDTELFDYHLLKKERFIAVASIHHPLAHQNISFEQLYDYPLFIREKGSGTRDILENYLHQTIYSLSRFSQLVEIGSLSMIKTMLMDTQAITFVYAGVVEQEIKNKQLVELHIQNFDITRPMHFIYLQSHIHKKYYQELFNTMTK